MVLVTGAGGFLGRRIVEALRGRGGGDVRAMVRRTRGEPWGAGVEEIVGNLLSVDDARRAVEGADVIVHAAAAMRGAPADLFLNTVVGSKNLLEALGGARPRIVLVSSLAVYGTGSLPRAAVVDENTPLEPYPERRDAYTQSKIRQERLFAEYRERLGFPLTTLRPGVLYGPGGGGGLSSRVGVSMFGLFLSLGRRNLLPLSYVDNCAEAVATAVERPEAAGEAYNVVDDDLPTCGEYLRAFEKNVGRMRSIPVPYPALMAISGIVEWYHNYSKGQLPAAFHPYETRTLWVGKKFDNRKMKGLGWRPRVPAPEGMRRAFEYLRARG